MALWFVIMKLAGFIYVLELRFLNIFLLLGGIILAEKEYSKVKNEKFNYFNGFRVGIKTAFVATVSFSALILLYLLFVEPSFLDVIKEKEPLGSHLYNPYMVFIAMVVQGLAYGLLETFVVMQYMKAYTNQLANE